MRKIYHILAILMFVPGTLWMPGMMCLSYGVAISVLLVLECARSFAVRPVGATLHAFIMAHVDARDAGGLVCTHIYLLLGCALPAWLSPKEAWYNGVFSSKFTPVGEPLLVQLIPFAGIMALGVGDAAAAVVGTRYGRTKWTSGSKKSVEGSVAMLVAMLGFAAALVWGMRAGDMGTGMALRGRNSGGGGGGNDGDGAVGTYWTAGKLVFATALCVALEASTDQIDNLVLPLHYAAVLLLAGASHGGVASVLGDLLGSFHY